MDLLEIRDKIDGIDSQIVDLYEKRMDLCKQVAEYKIETGKQVFDKEREKQKIEKVMDLAHGDFNKQGVAGLFNQLMAISRKLQYGLLIERGIGGKLPFVRVDDLEYDTATVVFQGAEGAYSHAAMNKYFGENVKSFHVETFRDAMLAIDDGTADYAVLPIENSTAGSVNEIYDLLEEFENYIVGEVIIKIEHCLMGVKGTEISDIKEVYSHAQSLMQSQRFLRDYSWQQISMKNNAFAAMKVRDDNDKSRAAIASEYSAKLYGLDILKKGVNNSDTNSTRFIVVSNQKKFVKNANKISICLEMPNESGSLFTMLSHFYYNGLNLNRIESRPIEGKNWQYRFFIDFDGNLSDSAVKNALSGLRQESFNMKILGNYINAK